MLYTGIDYHKRYSVVCTLDGEGRRVQSARIDQNEPAAFAAYFQRLPEPSRTVLEVCWNGGWLYDLLGEFAAWWGALYFLSIASRLALNSVPGFHSGHCAIKRGHV